MLIVAEVLYIPTDVSTNRARVIKINLCRKILKKMEAVEGSRIFFFSKFPDLIRKHAHPLINSLDPRSCIRNRLRLITSDRVNTYKSGNFWKSSRSSRSRLLRLGYRCKLALSRVKFVGDRSTSCRIENGPACPVTKLIAPRPAEEIAEKRASRERKRENTH